MEKVLIVGAEGNMGRRYRAILEYLKVKVYGVDVDLPVTSRDVRLYAKECDGIIIATPTELHAHHIAVYAEYEKPILCEKPISKSARELGAICDLCTEENVDLEMVNQYRYMSIGLCGDSHYDYWNTGKDGLYWDCISILGLAYDNVWLGNKSPVWKCRINGQDLNPAQMDYAYIEMIKKWMAGADLGGLRYIEHAHEAVRKYIEKHISTDWNSSSVNFNATTE